MVEVTRVITASIELTCIEKAEKGKERFTEEQLKTELEKSFYKTNCFDDVHFSKVKIKDFEMDVKK